MVPRDDEIADIESRLMSNDELDRSLSRRSSKKSPRKSTGSFAADGSPRHVSSVVENASDTASVEDTAAAGMLAKKRRSETGIALGNSSSKVQRTNASPLSKSGISRKHNQESRVERRSGSKDGSFAASPSKTLSARKATPPRRKTPEVNKAFGSERRQKSENSIQNTAVNTSVSKDVSPAAKSLRRDVEPGKRRKIERKKSMRSTAVSTDDLVHIGYHVDDGENCDLRTETLVDEKEFQVGNRKFPTRYIIIEEGPRSREVVGRYNDVGTGSLRQSKFRRQGT